MESRNGRRHYSEETYRKMQERGRALARKYGFKRKTRRDERSEGRRRAGEDRKEPKARKRNGTRRRRSGLLGL